MRLAAAALFLLLVWQGSGVTPRAVASDVLLRGRAVYEGTCAVCHGAGGDGNGMAAHMFRVQPRDFRRGLFKFRSTPSGSLPRDGDLMRTITEGIRWTGMVGRPDLPEADRAAVVQYLKTFSPRRCRPTGIRWRAGRSGRWSTTSSPWCRPNAGSRRSGPSGRSR
ncbi:MAG: cytochrome c [Candidatus Rokubacteria bacterium]|nr:cytochrome c [Candidatus Rokubacteria bacterium]